MSDENKPDSPPLVNVQIDGEWLKFPKGKRIIEACREAGKFIPHYCYHPKLSSPGNCRMCLIEVGMPPRPGSGHEPELDEEGMPVIQWMPRPMISCANTVSEGMGVRTDSALTTECRNAVMEFLLLNHPLDCPICDQAGECELQEFSVEYGKGESRFLEAKNKKPKNVKLGPRVTLDDERCILCSRCVRFCEEVVDDPVLGFVERGSHSYLTAHPGKPLANNYSLNTVDLCPVGALTSTDFRFQMRVWFLKETDTICTSCGRGCNIKVGSREARVYRRTPRENNAVNSSWMCDFGRLDIHHLHSDARLTDPMIRTADGHKVAAWSDALAAAAGPLNGFEAGEIAVLASGRMTNEELFLARELGKALGGALAGIVPREDKPDAYLVAADRNPNTNGARLALGVSQPGNELDAIREGVASGKIKALLAFHEDLIAAGFRADALRKLDLLVVCHTQANPAAELAHVVLPGAEAAEKRGSMVNVTGRLQRLSQAVQPPGQAREDWEILRDLLASVTGDDGPPSLEDVFKKMAGEVTAFNGLNLGRIGGLGVDVLETGEFVPLLAREREKAAQGLIAGA